MKRIKKIVAIAAASMLLCGFTGQAAEGDAEAASPRIHVHAYSTETNESPCIDCSTESQHTYLSGVEIGPTGESKNIYSTCYVVLFYYRDLYKCACGDQYYKVRAERRHMNCGQVICCRPAGKEKV